MNKEVGNAQNLQLSYKDVVAVVAASVVSSLTLFLVAGLAFQIRGSMHFSVSTLGSVISLYYLCAALGSVPMSRLVEMLGALRSIRWGCMLMAALLLILAAGVHHIVGLAAVMAMAGVLSSGLQPATNLFLVRRVPHEYRGFAFGVKQAAVPMAVLLGGLAVPAFGLTVGWRWAFVTAAFLAFIASISTPRSRYSFAQYRANPPPIDKLGTDGVFNLILLAVGFGLGIASASALAGFVVTATVALGQGEGMAGVLAGVGGLAAAATRIALGLYADRGDRPHFVIVATMLCIGAVAYATLAFFTKATTVVLVPLIVIAFSAGWGWNGLFNLAIVNRYTSQAARATGITSVGGRAGGVVGPLVFGLVVDHFSFRVAWLLVSLASVCGAMVILGGRRRFARGLGH